MDAGTWMVVLGTVWAVLLTMLVMLLKAKLSKKTPLSRSTVGARSKKKWSRIRIFYGTQTGTAKQFAEDLSAEFSSSHVVGVGGNVSVADLRQCSDPEEILTQQVRACTRGQHHPRDLCALPRGSGLGDGFIQYLTAKPVRVDSCPRYCCK